MQFQKPLLRVDDCLQQLNANLLKPFYELQFLKQKITLYLVSAKTYSECVQLEPLTVIIKLIAQFRR